MIHLFSFIKVFHLRELTFTIQYITLHQLVSRAAKCQRQHHRSIGPTTGRNPGGRQKKTLHQLIIVIERENILCVLDYVSFIESMLRLTCSILFQQVEWVEAVTCPVVKLPTPRLLWPNHQANKTQPRNLQTLQQSAELDKKLYRKLSQGVCSNHLNTKQVLYSNGPNISGFQMVV